MEITILCNVICYRMHSRQNQLYKLISAPDGVEWSTPHQGSFTSGKDAWTYWTVRLGDPQSQSGDDSQKEICVPAGK
jgi:hypothetical protein